MESPVQAKAVPNKFPNTFRKRDKGGGEKAYSCCNVSEHMN